MLGGWLEEVYHFEDRGGVSMSCGGMFILLGRLSTSAHEKLDWEM